MISAQALGEFLLYQTEDSQTRLQLVLAESSIKAKAEAEYTCYLEQQKALPNKVEQDFYASLQAPVETINTLTQQRKMQKAVKKDFS